MRIDSVEQSFDIIIEPRKKISNYWSELWRFRSVLFFLAWRDFLVRYKQTVIGISWSIIRPLLTLVVFSVVFGKIANLSSEGVPYSLLVCAALIPWQFFSNAFMETSQSLIANSNLLSKVYFPRLLIPASTLLVAIVDFLISFIILIALMIWHQFVPPVHIVLLPVFFLFALMVSFGAGVFISAVNVKYRDFRYVVPFIIQVGLYISPVGFSTGVVPEKFRLLYSLNPMVGVIDGFRWCLLGGQSFIYVPGFLLSVAITIALTVFGLYYFRKVERGFADAI
jgi:lipopolysaccharide transport system permease protein